MNVLIKVAGFGAVGGLLFWLLAEFAGASPYPSWPSAGQILALCILGAAAGCVGVYILTASDLAQVKTYVFAMLCGLVWKPILDAGVATVQKGAINKQTAEIADQTSALRNISAKSDAAPQAIQSQLDATKSAALTAVNSIGQAQDPAQKDALVKTTNDAVSTFAAASEKSPASVDAIKEVAMQAIQSREPGVAVKSIQSLGTIATESNNPAAKKRAQIYLREIQKVAVTENQPSTANYAKSLLEKPM